MSTYTSKYPALLVKFSNRERVRFHRGSAEVSGDLDARLAEFAKANPEYGIERVEGDEPPRETEKQRLQREAGDRGLDTKGTKAELEARIAAHDAQQGDDGDDEDSDGHDDGDDADDAGDDESSEDDENSEDE